MARSVVAGDPSLRLKNVYAQDDVRIGSNKGAPFLRSALCLESPSRIYCTPLLDSLYCTSLPDITYCTTFSVNCTEFCTGAAPPVLAVTVTV
jgi:hypothetical protein